MKKEKTAEELKLEVEKKAEKDIKVVKVMIHMYCKTHHHPDGYLCDECQELLEYVKFRRSKCPWGKDKPFCAHCPIQCYKPVMKERIVKVMRYSGPRITFTHPILATKHIIEAIGYQLRKALGIAPKMPPKKVKPKTDKPAVKSEKVLGSDVKAPTNNVVKAGIAKSEENTKAMANVDETANVKDITTNVEATNNQVLTEVDKNIESNVEANIQSEATDVAEQK